MSQLDFLASGRSASGSIGAASDERTCKPRKDTESRESLSGQPFLVVPQVKALPSNGLLIRWL